MIFERGLELRKGAICGPGYWLCSHPSGPRDRYRWTVEDQILDFVSTDTPETLHHDVLTSHAWSTGQWEHDFECSHQEVWRGTAG
jgi:hypothetical protein